MAIHHPGTIPGPKGFDPRRFFEEVVAGALVTRQKAGERLGGAVRVEVEGVGTWRIDLARAVVEVSQAEANASIKVGAPELEALIRGKLDVAAALRDQRLFLDGDPGALQRLSLLLRP
ncbi:MAG: SCP2 sterol-binding domain-containing protein [Myxococcota bacterium]